MSHPHRSHPHVDVDMAVGPVICGTTVLVARLWFWHRHGVTFEQLQKRYPKLKPSWILDALSFAYDHPDAFPLDQHHEPVQLRLAGVR